MPELPEVETIAATLRTGKDGLPGILGLTIRFASLTWDRTLAEPAVEEFLPRIQGQSILSVSRRGKFLILQLDRDFLLIHLRMSGDIYMEPEDAPLSPDRGALSGLRL